MAAGTVELERRVSLVTEIPARGPKAHR
jgi:hypothetical protein